VTAHTVVCVEQLVQQNAALGAWIEGRSRDGHRLPRSGNVERGQVVAASGAAKDRMALSAQITAGF
jgi:hypothetical protein